MQSSANRDPRRSRSGDEHDVHTTWRRVYCWTQRPGATAATKRRTRRRERREQARDLARRTLEDT